MILDDNYFLVFSNRIVDVDKHVLRQLRTKYLISYFDGAHLTKNYLLWTSSKRRRIR